MKYTTYEQEKKNRFFHILDAFTFLIFGVFNYFQLGFWAIVWYKSDFSSLAGAFFILDVMISYHMIASYFHFFMLAKGEKY